MQGASNHVSAVYYTLQHGPIANGVQAVYPGKAGEGALIDMAGQVHLHRLL